MFIGYLTRPTTKRCRRDVDYGTKEKMHAPIAPNSWFQLSRTIKACSWWEKR